MRKVVKLKPQDAQNKNIETILALTYMESNKNKRNTKCTQNQTKNKKHEMQQKKTMKT